MADIIGQPKSPKGVFRRIDGYSIEVGKAVCYELAGYEFKIIATRFGVEVMGHFPVVTRAGILALEQVLIRAVRHHEHLASFAEGIKQEALTEDILAVEETLNAPLPDPKKRIHTVG